MEWIYAAVWAHYKQEEFEQLPGEEQSRIVAAYLIEKQLDAVTAYAQEQKQKAETRKNARRS